LTQSETHFTLTQSETHFTLTQSETFVNSVRITSVSHPTCMCVCVRVSVWVSGACARPCVCVCVCARVCVCMCVYAHTLTLLLCWLIFRHSQLFQPVTRGFCFSSSNTLLCSELISPRHSAVRLNGRFLFR